MSVGAPVSAFAAEAPGNDNAGRLNLTTDVLVTESVNAGSTGDFVVRGALFSEEFTARAQAQRAIETERVANVRSLDFSRAETSAVDYQPVRESLFDGYSPQDLVQTAQEVNDDSPTFYGVAALVAVPLTLVAGVALGRFWARRKRATS
ncbi:hypothetical protein HQQ80_19820 [Microbacteriaceae bacterium VKM Ac-2855]|nr:hypothetical protein [Microbacteriaceae bacterium VKM Ac-2855]